ncbi:MAG: glutathione synthase [Polyangiaceae bacterium]|nr:glutathione synthase [Polyangiaceae bacterium]
MRFAFVMDTLDRVSPDKDTTYGFIEAAQARGHQSYHCQPHEVGHAEGRVRAVVRPIRERPGALELTGDYERLWLDEVDAVFVRKDPPFDQAYFYLTLVLERLRGKTLVVNDPRGLRDANEKLYALEFPELVPRTLVSSDRLALLDFVAAVGGHAVIKPLDGAGGWGVLSLRSDDRNARAIVDLHTLEGKKLALVQEYLPAVAEGDKRVLLLDGELLGAIVRVPMQGELRANIHVGGSVAPTELTARELELVAAMGPRLRRDGLVFVGLDLIGERLTEVNVTSPTGIRELSRFTGERVSDRVIEWVERHALPR